MKLNFAWDEVKGNVKKHGISFDEDTTVFSDPLSISVSDPDHLEDEGYIDIGISDHERLLVAVYTERGDKIRIISCRKATSLELKYYG
jgi:uncharacterized DUF497 family protein